MWKDSQGTDQCFSAASVQCNWVAVAQQEAGELSNTLASFQALFFVQLMGTSMAYGNETIDI